MYHILIIIIAPNFQGKLFLQIGNTGCFAETICVDKIWFTVDYVIFCELNFAILHGSCEHYVPWLYDCASLSVHV